MDRMVSSVYLLGRVPGAARVEAGAREAALTAVETSALYSGSISLNLDEMAGFLPKTIGAAKPAHCQRQLNSAASGRQIRRTIQDPARETALAAGAV
jgi:hypothetical protein